MDILEIILIIFTVIYCFSISYLLIGLFRIPRRTNQKQHFITVIIAVHNEEKHLEQCLDCIAMQDYSQDKYEVIIADDRSTDRTPEIISRFCFQYQNFKSVRVEDSPDVIPKKTVLIKGLDIAKGEIIVSTDGDCTLSETWLSSLNECFTEDIGMVIGHTIYKKPATLWKGIDTIDYFSQRALGIAFIGIGSAYTCTASNFAYRKEIYDNNKNEFTTIKVRPAEDNYLLHCVHKKSDFRIAAATSPGSYVTTEGATSFQQFMNQRFRWGVYGGNITTFGVNLFFIPALLYYVLIWMSLVSAVFNTHILYTVLISLICKILVDFIFMLRATVLYKCFYLLKYFLPISIIHLALVPVIVLKGNLFTFDWKGRRYNKTAEIKMQK